MDLRQYDAVTERGCLWCADGNTTDSEPRPCYVASGNPQRQPVQWPGELSLLGWAEAGHVPDLRICVGSGRFQATERLYLTHRQGKRLAPAQLAGKQRYVVGLCARRYRAAEVSVAWHVSNAFLFDDAGCSTIH